MQRLGSCQRRTHLQRTNEEVCMLPVLAPADPVRLGDPTDIPELRLEVNPGAFTLLYAARLGYFAFCLYDLEASSRALMRPLTSALMRAL